MVIGICGKVGDFGRVASREVARKVRPRRRTAKKPQAPSKGAKGDLRVSLIRCLLRTDIRSAVARDPAKISEVLAKPYPSVTANLRQLTNPSVDRKSGERPAPKVYRAYMVDPFATEYCHAFRIALRVDGRVLAEKYARPSRRRASRLRSPGAAERFVEHLVGEAAENALVKDDLIITDAVVLHGAPDRDVELHVVTRNGVYSIGKYVRDVLTKHECVESATTVTVGWQYVFDGYSGHYANTGGRKAEVKDERREKTR